MQSAAFGSWESPISTALLTTAASSVSWPSSDNGNLYWLESRPQEQGRNTLMSKSPSGEISDLLPAPLSIKSSVHEYGGNSYLVNHGVVYFCLEDDQRIYQMQLDQPGCRPQPLTPKPDKDGRGLRFADLCFDAARQRLICVAEDHRTNGEPENFIAAIPLTSPLSPQQSTTPVEPEKLVSGDDFYAYPRINPNGEKLSWISWNHPHMPWDSTQLWLAELNVDGAIGSSRLVAGGDNIAIFQPQWSPDNQLFYVSDQSDWWNIYRYVVQGDDECICQMEAEFATPLWNLGMSTYGFLNATTLICCYTQQSTWHLATIDLTAQQLTVISTPYSSFSGIFCQRDHAYFVAGNAATNPIIASYNLADKQLHTVNQQQSLAVDDSYLAKPVYYRFPSAGEHAHLLFYPPTNPDYCGLEGERPPLIVICHGGPTAMSTPQLNFKIQFWTSRGFAVADINYRGSTGFGRHYRNRLHQQWGIADVEDAVNGAKFLADQNMIDANRTVIRGSSAGGYTVLAALAFADFFKAGACLYGIGNLETLASDTHKFESRYLDTLIGEYPKEQALYQQRSPINHIHNINCPVIFFQGMDDKVVPPQQTLTMHQALNDKQLPVACLLFEGESHGFRKAKTIEDSLLAELYFYSVILGFPVPDNCPAITINNIA